MYTNYIAFPGHRSLRVGIHMVILFSTQGIFRVHYAALRFECRREIPAMVRPTCRAFALDLELRAPVKQISCRPREQISIGSLLQHGYMDSKPRGLRIGDCGIREREWSGKYIVREEGCELDRDDIINP